MAMHRNAPVVVAPFKGTLCRHGNVSEIAFFTTGAYTRWRQGVRSGLRLRVAVANVILPACGGVQNIERGHYIPPLWFEALVPILNTQQIT